MSKIKLTGESSGYVEISAGNAAGNNTLEAPTSGTRLVAHEGSQDVTLNGNLTVNGVVSYEDVTNIDSVGIMTARAGINVTGGNLTVDAFSNTANNYLSLRNGYVPSASGGMGFMSADHSGSNADGIAIYGHDGISLYTAQTERLRITSGGGLKFISADSPTSTTEPAQILNHSGGWQFYGSSGTSTHRNIIFCSASNAASEKLRIDSTGDVRFAGTNLTNNTNKNVNLTAPSYNTSEEDVNLVQVENESGFNQISFGGGTSALNAATNIRFLTASAVNTTTGTERLLITSDGKVRLPDNGNLTFGDNDDMLMRHSGNDAVIENMVGHIYISNYTNDEDIYLRTDDGSGGIANYVECDGSSGKVKLYHYGTKKFETDSSGVAIHEGTDKVVRFTGAIGEIGNVTGFQGSNTAGDALTDLGMRGTTLRFATGSAERMRIMSDGTVKIGTGTGNPILMLNASTSGTSVIQMGDSADNNIGQIHYVNSDDSMKFFTNNGERLRIDSDGNVNIGNKDYHSHNGTVDSLQIGYACNLYEDSYNNGDNNYAMWANNAYYRSGGGNYYMRNDEASRLWQYAGELYFENAAAGTAENAISFNQRLRITSGGNFHLSTGELKTTAGDKFAQIRGGGVINTKRLATGHFGNTAGYHPQQLGYIGDYMHYGCNAVYYLAQTSTGNSGYSSHMFSWYDSGHWGHYGKFVLMCHEGSYIGGMAHRYLSGTTVTDIFNIGNTGSVSTTQTLTGSGTHSGQSVYRYDCTVSHTSTYRTMRWYLGLFHGAQLGVTGNGKTQSEVQTYANSNGSILHLFGVSDSNLTMAPNYRTW